MVPVVLLTGFLGSGKTTLLNALLETRVEARKRMAIIVNEFGTIGIDGDLLPADMTRQVELPGGCICCVLNEDLDKTINELLDSAPDVQLIVIETTGIAEPLPISWTLAAEPLCTRVRLAAVITTVDAVEHERHRPLSPSVDAQVEYADLLVITKLDLTPNGQVPSALAEHLRTVNDVAPIIAGTTRDSAEALWQSLEDPDATDSAALAKLGQATPEPAHHHFDSVSVPIEQTLDFEELADCLAELPANYIRIKGIATVIDGSTGSNEPHLVAFHRVGARVSKEPLSGESATRTPEHRIVAIGRGVDSAQLAACVDASVVRCSD